MIILFAAQLLVPVLLLLWLLVFPAKSALGWGAQLLGSLVAMAAVTLTGLWLFPPWWVPRAVIICTLLLAAWQVYRPPWRSRLPQGALAWSGVALFAVAAALVAYPVWRARQAARIPENPPAVELAFPLDQGRYLVVNGGAWETLNAHRASMDSSIARLRPWRGNGHAVDLVAVDRFGLRATGVLPEDPAAYTIYGVRVLAPCAGRVLISVDGFRDMLVPQQDLENMAGNHVILDCAGVHVILAHFQPGTLQVHAGERVERSQWIASVGNSGMSSEPHLHVHAQRPGPPGTPMGGDPLPMRLDGRYLVRGDRVVVRQQ